MHFMHLQSMSCEPSDMVFQTWWSDWRVHNWIIFDFYRRPWLQVPTAHMNLSHSCTLLMSLCQNTAPFRDRINKREFLDHSLWLATSHVKQLQKLNLLNLPNSHHKFIPQKVEPLWCTKRQDCLLSCQLTTCSATLELATSSHLKTR